MPDPVTPDELDYPDAPSWDDLVSMWDDIGDDLVGDPDDADRRAWMLRIMSHAERRLRDTTDRYAAELERLDRWHAEATKQDRAVIERFGDALKSWAIARREATGETIWKDPPGTISTRRAPFRVAVPKDHEAEIKGLLADAGLADYLKVTIEPSLSSLQGAIEISPERAVNSEGEVLDRPKKAKTWPPEGMEALPPALQLPPDLAAVQGLIDLLTISGGGVTASVKPT